MAIKAKVDEILSDMKSITSIPLFALSPAKKINKDDGEGKKDEKMKTRFLEAWNNIRYEFGAGATLKKDVPIWILGVCHHSRSDELPSGAEEDEVPVFNTALAKRVFTDFASRPWFTYRKNFPPILGTDITSDTGWGCMLRSAQMMVAQGLIIHFLGRDWRWPQRQTSHETHLHRKILGWFVDDPGEHCPLSIHHLSEIGRGYGNVPGNWYGPNTVAYIMKQAVEDAKKKVNELRDVVVYVAQDCTVYSEDVYDQCGWRDFTEPQVPAHFDLDSQCSSSASSAEEACSEGFEMPPFFVPQTSAEHCIPTSKIVNNLIPMTEFNNVKHFHPDLEVEQWLKVGNRTPTRNSTNSASANLPNASSGNKNPTSKGATTVPRSASAAHNMQNTLLIVRTLGSTTQNSEPVTPNVLPVADEGGVSTSNASPCVEICSKEIEHTNAQAETWVKVADRPFATERSTAKTGAIPVAQNIGKPTDTLLFLEETTPRKVEMEENMPKHVMKEKIVLCNKPASDSPVVESTAIQSKPTEKMPDVLDTNSNAKSRIGQSGLVSETSTNTPETMAERNVSSLEHSKIEEILTSSSHCKDNDSFFAESETARAEQINFTPVPPGVPLSRKCCQEGPQSSNEMFLSSYIEIQTFDEAQTLLPQKTGTSVTYRDGVQKDLRQGNSLVRDGVTSPKTFAADCLHTSDKELPTKRSQASGINEEFHLPKSSSEKQNYTITHEHAIGFFPPQPEDFSQNFRLNSSRIPRPSSSKSQTRPRSSTLGESGLTLDEGRKSTLRDSAPSATAAPTSLSKAALILVPVRLGESSLNPIYAPCITSMLTLNSSIGIMGGKPKHSLYFVGFQGENLIHLDPHYCQIADTLPGFKKNLHDYHTMSIRKINIKKIDPSCCLGFYCRTAQEFEDFKREGGKIFSPPRQPLGYPMCLIMDGRSGDHQIHSPTGLGNAHEYGEAAIDHTTNMKSLPVSEAGKYSAADDVGLKKKNIPQNCSHPAADTKKAKARKKSRQEGSRLNILNSFPRIMRQKSSSPISARKTRISEESLESQFELL